MIHEYCKVSDMDESVLDYAMGRNHHRDEEATRQRSSGELILPSASTGPKC